VLGLVSLSLNKVSQVNSCVFTSVQDSNSPIACVLITFRPQWNIFQEYLTLLGYIFFFRDIANRFGEDLFGFIFSFLYFWVFVQNFWSVLVFYFQLIGLVLCKILLLNQKSYLLASSFQMIFGDRVFGFWFSRDWCEISKLRRLKKAFFLHLQNWKLKNLYFFSE